MWRLQEDNQRSRVTAETSASVSGAWTRQPSVAMETPPTVQILDNNCQETRMTSVPYNV